jgi:hypothetical protein
MKALLSTLAFIVFGAGKAQPDPNTATYKGCDHARGEYSTAQENENGFVPGLYVTTSNLPGATYNKDGSLANRKIVCSHMDRRTTGGSVIIPWAQFDKGNGNYDWTFVDQQMQPWIDRGQMVNLLVWPAVQKKDQLFPEGESATPDYIMNLGMTYECPDGSTQGHNSEGIPLPMFWERSVYRSYTKALKQLVRQYQNHPNINYFRFGIGVGAESYPANGATTPTNFCMETFVDQFEGDTYEQKAQDAYKTWKNFVKKRIRAFRRFNSKKPIVVTINDYYTLPSIDKNEFPRTIAHEATRSYRNYPKLGLGVQGATTIAFDEHRLDGARCHADWCNIFDSAKSLGIPLQLQTPLHSGVNGRPGEWQNYEECKTHRQNNGRYGCTNTGNLKDLIDYSLSVGVNAFELYPYEWMVANDENWVNDPPELNWHVQYGEEYGNALDRASNQQLA